MDELKEYDFNDLLKSGMKNKEFAKEYEALEKEYTLAKEFIKLRKYHRLSAYPLSRNYA